MNRTRSIFFLSSLLFFATTSVALLHQEGGQVARSHAYTHVHYVAK